MCRQTQKRSLNDILLIKSYLDVKLSFAFYSRNNFFDYILLRSWLQVYPVKEFVLLLLLEKTK